jgi:hypothetical protein
MTDFFGNQYWPGRFWAVNYFQGGDLPEGAMQAALSGAASISADLSAIGAAPVIAGGQSRRRNRIRLSWPKAYPPAIVAVAGARIGGASRIEASLSAAGLAQSAIVAGASVGGTATRIDVKADEAAFWLMAA